ncbi:MAG: MASE1 domain-containing protein [Leptospiraceae bacterium]|nr:MASE1 domain-containing protein [Leptospiraceae bacterium]
MKSKLSLILNTCLIALFYILAAKLGFFLAFLNSQVSPIWPPEGVAFAAIVILGRSAIPGIFLGATLANYLNNPHIPTSFIIGFGNTFGVILNSYLLNKFVGSSKIFDSAANLIKFILFCTLPGSSLSAIIGVTSLLIFGFVPQEVYWNVLLTWCSGEMQGFIIVAPFLLTWWDFPKWKIDLHRFIEIIIFSLFLLVSSLLAFREKVPLAYLPFPFIIWASLRFQKYGATLAIVFLSGIAVYRTITGVGPFAVYLEGKISLNNSLILLDIYIAVATIISYVLVTVMRERARAQMSVVENLKIIERMKDRANHELEKKVVERTVIIEKQKLELEKQIEMAGKIQDSLLPANVPDLEKLKIAVKFQPMMKLGGDFFDLRYSKSHNSFGFFLCDVSGHGVPAALLAAMVKMSLTYWYDHLHKLTETFQFIYESIYDKLGKNFITASLIHINLRNGKLTTARAGHFPVMIITKEGKVIRLNSHGKIIMALKKPDSEEVEYRLQPGDRIVVYTDGIIEAHGPNSYNLFSEEKMISMLLDSNHVDIHILAEQIFQSVVEYSGGLKFLDDDLTFVIMEYTP